MPVNLRFAHRRTVMNGMFERIVRTVAQEARNAAIREINQQMQTAQGMERIAWLAALIFLTGNGKEPKK